MHICLRNHEQSQAYCTLTSSSQAVITLINESMESWRHDLPALSCSPHPLSIAELMEQELGKVDGQKLVKCRNDSGRPVQVRIIPLWQGAREVATPIPSTCTLDELSEHVFDLYHVDKSALQFFFNAVDSRLQVREWPTGLLYTPKAHSFKLSSPLPFYVGGID